MMIYKLILFCALFLLMMITGVFWGTWFTLTRSINDFSAEEFIHIGKVIIANVAVPMSIIMPSGIILMVASVWQVKKRRLAGFIPGMISLVLIIAVLLITLIILVPIDNDITKWTSSTIPANWEAIRAKWDLWHTVRTFLSLISFACFSYLVSRRNAK